MAIAILVIGVRSVYIEEIVDDKFSKMKCSDFQ